MRPRRLLLYGHDIVMNLHSMFYNFNAMTVINNLCCLNPTVPFGSSIDYRLSTMTTFFEIAVFHILWIHSTERITGVVCSVRSCRLESDGCLQSDPLEE